MLLRAAESWISGAPEAGQALSAQGRADWISTSNWDLVHYSNSHGPSRTSSTPPANSTEPQRRNSQATHLMATMLHSDFRVVGVPSCWYSDGCPASMPSRERQMNGCFTFEMCCMFDGRHGERCWAPDSFFTFENCCALAVDSDNQHHIPYWHSRQVLVRLQSQFARRVARRESQVLRLYQDVPGTPEGESRSELGRISFL